MSSRPASRVSWPVADPDLELRGVGVVLFCLPCHLFFSFFCDFFRFTQNKGGPPGPSPRSTIHSLWKQTSFFVPGLRGRLFSQATVDKRAAWLICHAQKSRANNLVNYFRSASRSNFILIIFMDKCFENAKKQPLFWYQLPTVRLLTIYYTIRLWTRDFYLNNRVFLSRIYRVIVAPRKFDVLETNICPRSEASRANMLVLRTSNFQGQLSVRPMVPRHNHSIEVARLDFLGGISPNFERQLCWRE